MDDGNNVYRIEGKLKDLMLQGFKACIVKMLGSGLLHRVEGSFFRNIVTHYLTWCNNPKDYHMIQRFLKKKFKLDITLYV